MRVDSSGDTVSVELLDFKQWGVGGKERGLQVKSQPKVGLNLLIKLIEPSRTRTCDPLVKRTVPACFTEITMAN
jgi:hypothetical protein